MMMRYSALIHLVATENLYFRIGKEYEPAATPALYCDLSVYLFAAAC